MVFSLATLAAPSYLNGNDWASINNLSSQYIQTMVKIVPGNAPATIEKQLNSVRQSRIQEQDGTLLHLQALRHMHLHSSFDDRYPTYGNLRYIYVLGLVAILIVCMAWFNYVNLATAHAIKRAHEIGIRKIIGASRAALVRLYLTESITINLLAFSLALLLVYLIQPFFNSIIQKQLSLTSIRWNSSTLIGTLIFMAGILLSGWYTALVITRLQPLAVLKNRLAKSGKGIAIRKLLVVTQFAISIGLVLSTFVIYQQLRFMQNSDLGMNIEKMVLLKAVMRQEKPVFRRRLNPIHRFRILQSQDPFPAPITIFVRQDLLNRVLLNPLNKNPSLFRLLITVTFLLFEYH
jgi:putative ABC transport system permease protein